MVNINTIINWFKKGCYPTESQFAETWSSFWHKQEAIPPNNIEGLSQILSDKADRTFVINTISQTNGVGAKIQITEAGFDVEFSAPVPDGFDWRFNSKPYCSNADGLEVGYTITNRTNNGFRVVPVEASTFEYTYLTFEL